MRRIIGFTRFLALLGVASSVLLSGVLFLSAFVRAAALAIHAVGALGREDTFHHLIPAAVEHADALLIATALLVIGMGLYTIFIGRSESLPPSLTVASFDELKDRLAGVVIVALAVRFFTLALNGGSGSDVLPFGLGIAAVILSVTAYSVLHRPRRGEGHGPAASRHAGAGMPAGRAGPPGGAARGPERPDA